MADPQSTTALWIITLTVVGLVIVFGGFASLARRRTDAQPSPEFEGQAAAAVANYDKAAIVAKKAQQVQQSATHEEKDLSENG